MTPDTIKAIGERHALGVPDRTRFNPVRAYVEEVASALRGKDAPLPDDIEQRIERVVADRLADVYGRLNAIEDELKRRRGGRKPKEQENG